MVMGGDSSPKVVGSNPGTIYWMDIFTHIFCKNCNDVCLKRPKLNDKRGRVWPIFLVYNQGDQIGRFFGLWATF